MKRKGAYWSSRKIAAGDLPQEKREMATIVIKSSYKGRYAHNCATGRWVEITKSMGFICVEPDGTPVKQTMDVNEAFCFLLDLPYDVNAYKEDL